MDEICELAQKRVPFLFIISYDKKERFVQPLANLGEDISFSIGENSKLTEKRRKYRLKKSPISYANYENSFKKIIEEIKRGNTYLLNLTFETPIETDLSLREIYDCAKAKYKLYFKDKFVCFSPERFVEIENNQISTYPMKGTIEAKLTDAEKRILSDRKEMAEHIMIVDLMRNDLSMVAKNVRVEKFRYIDKIVAGDKELLQVSSKITGELPENWRENLGEILNKILPAGSISGTPKKSTIDIIKTVENYQRGFYTGIFGIFDGRDLKSATMIRFVEKINEQMFYKSGGGITIDSNPKNEYKELIDKIYLPL